MPSRGTRANLQAGDLGKGCGLFEETDQLRVNVDEIPIRSDGGCRHFRHDLFERGEPRRFRDGEDIDRARQYCPADELQLAICHRSRGISRRDDLALLGQLDAASYRTRWKRQDGDVGGTAATADRAATAMKEGVTDPFSIEQRGQAALRLVESPCGTEKSDLFVRVGIADHDLLEVPTGP